MWNKVNVCRVWCGLVWVRVRVWCGLRLGFVRYGVGWCGLGLGFVGYGVG